MTLSPDVVRQACAQRVAEHARAQRERGLIRCAVWIPAADRELLARYATQLRAKAGVPLPADPPPRKASKPKPAKKTAKKNAKKKRSTSAEKPKKKRSPSKERRYQRRKAERDARQ